MMKRNLLLRAAMLAGVMLSFWGASAASADELKPAWPEIEMRLRFFEGSRLTKSDPVKVVTSSFLRHTISASVKADDQVPEEKKLREIFNLKDVRMLTESSLKWNGASEQDFSIFSLDSKEYAVLVHRPAVSPSPHTAMYLYTFRIEVLEQNKGSKISLLDSEFKMEGDALTYFGFEDAAGNPYFISLKIIKARVPSDGQSLSPFLGGVEAGVKGGVSGGVKDNEDAKAAREIADAIKAGRPVPIIGLLKPPKLVKMVSPAYPEVAKQAKVSGMVILEAHTGVDGRVKEVKILRSIPLLDQAAIDSVKQWVYEPCVIEGKAREVYFTVTVSFRPKEQ